MKKVGKYILLLVVVAFALLTLFLSSSVIFDLFGIRAKEGNYVIFVVYANFFSSLLYLIAAFGIVKNKKWIVKPFLVSILLLILAQIGLYTHIDAGGLYEIKTVNAMYFRISVTVVFAIVAFFLKHFTHIKNN